MTIKPTGGGFSSHPIAAGEDEIERERERKKKRRRSGTVHNIDFERGSIANQIPLYPLKAPQRILKVREMRVAGVDCS